MKSTGIVRKTDQLGRIVIPSELRKVLDISDQDELEIFVDGDLIILHKYEPKCMFCGDTDDVINFRGKNVCRECREQLALLG
ncbi:lp hng hel abrb: transcriptional regulator abrb family [Lucifera butyrica]|uniref:Lp hng hel abrb: transcriptional regulator abrb family n=1 Tax=Lucifera butyrica TaxID=1351585 RepID=A0A498R350_9FIRM|nr:AbrB/MazE/SpoVT family DNA-binding domain-containing protein [Lucifera butyrica]VBB05599.1 lp hng hel abrb: transcriptional regulator abrb family [Lucifera butyrica]